jgi:hypothetical protein
MKFLRRWFPDDSPETKIVLTDAEAALWKERRPPLVRRTILASAASAAAGVACVWLLVAVARWSSGQPVTFKLPLLLLSLLPIACVMWVGLLTHLPQRQMEFIRTRRLLDAMARDDDRSDADWKDDGPGPRSDE